ncbi:B3 domain-containing protein Os03g0619600-like isoform X3 [Hordeum vulgare subsp. vulgare]|uniref:B3 domain-containing protein Os03g0619600-like isoform X3 n=1 Tax=Hordeum vulgare subsp. vulgare TaxID=112509 RepID=UPI001D1A5891|nr:B3 domain-containing protein Os03g0619600-like isoform X3 [Hordeum vulgare subsp. vulgare]
MIHVSPRNHRTLIGGQMSNSCQCCKRYWTHLHGKVRCFVTHMDRHSRHRMVIPERFVNYFAWKLSAAIELEAPNGNVYDVGITERRNKTLLRSGWEAFVDDNHIVEGDSLMFRYCGNCCFKVVVFDSSGCEKVVSCARSRRQININDQEPSTNSADISTSFSDGSTHSSARGRSVDWQSGTLGHCRKRARTDAISSPSDDFSAEDSPYEHESSESDDQMLATPLYVLSGKCYVTEEDEANIVELVREIQPEMPLLVAMMMKPSLKPYPDLVIPKDYALAHFPRKNQTIKLQLPEQSNKWHCEFRVKSDGGRCNLKECGFVRDNNLLEGDLCVFQPMTNRKGRTFKLMVHLLRKVTIDHPSGENLSTYGLPSTKNAPTLCIKEEPNDDEETFSSGYEDHRISERYKDISCDLPYMMLMGAHLTDVQEKIVLEKVGAIASDLHIYVAVMTKTNVRVALTFATQYAVKYLRNGSRSFVLQLEGKSQRWHGEMHDKKGALRISGGWTSFASDNGLQEGDICLFELMKNKGGLKKMTVYIICRELLV